jgi:putative nucleotidyltransferase with HDIG domain
MRLLRSVLVHLTVASVVPLAVLATLSLSAAAGLPGAPPLAPFARATGLALLVALAVAALLGRRLARRVTEPVRRCVTGALEIARGRFGHEVPIQAGTEVGDLAYAFNHMSRELASYDAENRRLIAALEEGYLATARSIAVAIDAKDPYTRGHSARVGRLALEVGRELGLGPATLQALECGGLLHDVGKIGVPEALLRKREPLTPDEILEMRAHPEIGAEIVRGAPFLRDAALAVRHHHERWDGSGYPDRLAGEAIPLVARIVGAADTFDACTSERPYQPAMGVEEALAVLKRLREKQLDPLVHDALVRVVRRAAAGRAQAAIA